MSYVSLAYANANIHYPTTKTKWDALSDTVKNAWIASAEQALDQVSANFWLGEKVDAQQVSQFPRDLLSAAQSKDRWDSVPDELKTLIRQEDSTVPDSLCKAVVTWICAKLDGSNFDTFRQMQDANVTDFTAGPISFTFDPKAKQVLPPPVWLIVYHLTNIWWNGKLSGYINIETGRA